jgi:hypothetical protein
MHGLNGYLEVIQTIQWGLEQSGHQARYGLNSVDPQAINILFGFQVLSMDDLSKMPRNTIIYHMEQIRDVPPERLRPQCHYAAQNFEIWDYTDANADTWKTLKAKCVQIVPIGYAPLLTRIARPALQDIDVLLYGLTNPLRLQALHRLSRAGLSVVYLSGLYGQARDDLIARSKIILNATLYEQSQIFEVVRVSYLLANAKAVVAIRAPKIWVDPDIENAVCFTTLERMVEDCRNLCANEDQRARIEATALDIIRKRDICPIIGEALSKSQALSTDLRA